MSDRRVAIIDGSRNMNALASKLPDEMELPGWGLQPLPHFAEALQEALLNDSIKEQPLHRIALVDVGVVCDVDDVHRLALALHGKLSSHLQL